MRRLVDFLCVFFKRASVRGWRPSLVTFSENDQCRLNSSGDSAISKKTGNIIISMFAAPKLALVPASQYYCDVTWSYRNVCAKFH